NAPGPLGSAVVNPAGLTLDAIKAVSFRITAAWEGAGYATLQTYDKGIVSYGRFQFTLSGGALANVLNRYLSSVPTSPLAAYANRVNARDVTLKNDQQFLAALRT